MGLSSSAITPSSSHGISVPKTAAQRCIPRHAAPPALNNIVRHARASTIRLSLTPADHHYILCIQDNGIGFDPDAIPDSHFGLTGINERAALYNGKAVVQSRPGEGTILTVHTGTGL
ncbi:MAG: hypothetical protein JXA25_10495 [Anaerolineales bacterium]|nr:hypothetical protein [Anaerolineales bacterium]